jgi:hypothetical protein
MRRGRPAIIFLYTVTLSRIGHSSKTARFSVDASYVSMAAYKSLAVDAVKEKDATASLRDDIETLSGRLWGTKPSILVKFIGNNGLASILEAKLSGIFLYCLVI